PTPHPTHTLTLSLHDALPICFAFADPNLPKGFSPFNIQNINGHLFVTYAKREDDEDDETAGPSLGVVNEFDANGNLVRRFASRGDRKSTRLNSSHEWISYAVF